MAVQHTPTQIYTIYWCIFWQDIGTHANSLIVIDIQNSFIVTDIQNNRYSTLLVLAWWRKWLPTPLWLNCHLNTQWWLIRLSGPWSCDSLRYCWFLEINFKQSRRTAELSLMSVWRSSSNCFQKPSGLAAFVVQLAPPECFRKQETSFSHVK